MRINYNLSAMLTNTQLLRNERNQQSAAERLASGLKINHAKDDPAGMAISNKMDVQIEGIRQASRNSSDGISVIETADSSLNEVTSIVQRMRELAVQAANDTNGLEDREAIQAEINSLTDEIDRVSENTEFNKKILLDGSLSRRTYTNNRKVEVTGLGDGVPTDKYGITITADARQAVFRGAYSSSISMTVDGLDYIPAVCQDEMKAGFDNYNVAGKEATLKTEAAGRVTINGQIIEFTGGETMDEIYRKLREGAEIVDVTCIASIQYGSGRDYGSGQEVGTEIMYDASGKYEDTAGYIPDPDGWKGQALVFVSKEYGSAEKMNISCDNALLAATLGLAGQTAIGVNLAHKATAEGTKTSVAEIKCYRSTDTFLEKMPNPPVVLDRSNKAHEKYFEDPTIAGMEIPALYDGGYIDLAAKDTNGNLINQKYITFYDKIDSLPADLKGEIRIDLYDPNYVDPVTSSHYRHSETVTIEAGYTAEQVFAKIQEACGSSVDVYLTDDVRKDSYTVLDEPYNYSQALVFRAKDMGEGTRLRVSCSNTELSLALGLPVCEWSVEGKDAKAEFTDGDTSKSGIQRIGYSNSATITTQGNKITVTDKNGFEIEMTAEKKTCATFYSDWSASGRVNKDATMKDGDEIGKVSGIGSTMGNYRGYPNGASENIITDVTGYGMMTVHVGANEDQIVDVDIPEISAKTLGIDALNVRSGYTADKAIAKLDAALTKISATRSKLGAYQNRFESAVASLNANEEDLTASVSRIRDVDMAQESTAYTQHSILVQAATSVLAQANDLPQQALQLIQ